MAAAQMYSDYGSAEGRLESILLGDNMLTIQIFDPLPIPGKSIKCVIDESLLAKAKESLGHRVRVTGLIHYYNGQILVDVEHFDVLPPVNELPDLTTTGPINITLWRTS